MLDSLVYLDNVLVVRETGFGVFCLYTAAALVAAFAIINRRDA